MTLKVKFILVLGLWRINLCIVIRVLEVTAENSDERNIQKTCFKLLSASESKIIIQRTVSSKLASVYEMLQKSLCVYGAIDCLPYGRGSLVYQVKPTGTNKLNAVQ